MNKKFLMFGILGLFTMVIVSAAVMPYLFSRNTTVDTEQTLTGLGLETETVLCDAGESCLGEVIEISSAANRDRTISVETEEETGIDVSYVGVLNLTKKDSSWIPIGTQIELIYTIVGDTFEFSGVPEGYTLIYYKDEVVGLTERLANPQPAIIVTSGIGSLPNSDDSNIDDLADYCQNPDNYAHCKGAKLWVVPTEDIDEGVLDWVNMANYYYETDLIYYFNNGEGEITIPANSFIEFYPQYTISPMINDTETYELTTEVIALD